MKRILCLLLLAALIFTGCSFQKQKQDTTLFYYCIKDQAKSDGRSMVASEEREISPNAFDIRTQLSLYLVGPLSEELVSPFRYVQLITVEKDGDHLKVQLVGGDVTMTEIQFHLACACMTMTCMELVDVDQVTITLGNRSATMSRDDLLLIDTVTPNSTQSEDTP